jgi:hypothetical protein
MSQVPHIMSPSCFKQSSRYLRYTSLISAHRSSLDCPISIILKLNIVKCQASIISTLKELQLCVACDICWHFYETTWWRTFGGNFFSTFATLGDIIYLLTYSRSWAFLEEPPIVQPLKKFPVSHGTRRFNTMFIRGLHWSLSWAISIHSIPSYLSKIHFNIVHPRTSSSSQWSLSFWVSHLYPICIPLLHHSCYMPRPYHPSWLDYSNYT